MLEIITNETAADLELLAQQQSQMRLAIIQNCLALDYLLAEEGVVRGKFSQTDSCLQTDDNGKAVIDIAKHTRKIAHVPVQTWKGWDTDGLFGGWFSWLGGFKTMIGMVIVILAYSLPHIPLNQSCNRVHRGSCPMEDGHPVAAFKGIPASASDSYRCTLSIKTGGMR